MSRETWLIVGFLLSVAFWGITAIYRAWADGVVDGHAGRSCQPDCWLVLHAVWISGYAYGAQARLLERDADIKRAARREWEDSQ